MFSLPTQNGNYSLITPFFKTIVFGTAYLMDFFQSILFYSIFMPAKMYDFDFL